MKLFNWKKKKPKLLIVGHDLKFLSPVINHITDIDNYIVELFTYNGHIIQRKKQLLKLLPKVKIIFCEWGLGNISFLSNNKLPGQKLIVRVHLQEFRTNYLKETNWENVDTVIFISQFQFDRFKLQFPQFSEKCKLIFNVIDSNSFDKKKSIDAKFNLGMMGILPYRKWPHLGIEILYELRKHDVRYKLSIKSKKPEELGWLWERPEEREYYDSFYKLIKSYNLTDSVVFEPHDNDVQDWFSNIGFVLSTSEFEGSHQSVAEGMAAGSIPIIRNWDGSTPLYPKKYTFEIIKDAVDIILNYSEDMDFQKESKIVKQYAQSNFDLSVILPQFDELFDC